MKLAASSQVYFLASALGDPERLLLVRCCSMHIDKLWNFIMFAISWKIPSFGGDGAVPHLHVNYVGEQPS